MNGANYYDELTPDVTSYDYDALLTEDGRVTEKYRLFQAEIAKRVGPTPQMATEDIPRMAYGAAKEVASAPLMTLAEQLPAVQSLVPRSMERLGQSYGYTLYRTTLSNEAELTSIRLVDANDRAHVLLDGHIIATLYDRELLTAYTFAQPVPVRSGARLEILVENMGRVNYSFMLERQRKGIDGCVVLNGHQHYGWEMVALDEAALCSLQMEGQSAVTGAPSVRRLSFRVERRGDTFLALPGWGKATVFLNGFCLGRMWEIGPQKRLYVPGPMLRQGENELLIVETEGHTGKALLLDEPDLG